MLRPLERMAGDCRAGKWKMIVAHITDLHISKYGLRMTNLSTGRLRAARGMGWETFLEDSGWRIDYRPAQDQARIRNAFRLVDGEGQVHKIIKAKHTTLASAIIAQLLRLRDLRMQTRCDALAADFPENDKVKKLLARDPDNGNIRFCAVISALHQNQPDWVVITGDLTDDGVGYDLIKLGLGPFIAQRRLICLPGNHDIYPTPPVWNDKRLRTSETKKRQVWQDFMASIGQPVSEAFVQDLGEGVVLARLDSCHPSRIPGSSSGLITPEQIRAIAEQLAAHDASTLRLACLHHPLMPMPYKGLNIGSYQPGMRLRNGRRTFKHLLKFGFSVIMSGHRHVGYHFQHPAGPVTLSAPSTTYGCRSGAKPFYWSLDLIKGRIRGIQPTPIATLNDVPIPVVERG